MSDNPAEARSAWAQPPEGVDPKAAYFEAQVVSGGASGTFILSESDTTRMMEMVDEGQPFRLWIAIRTNGRSSGLFILPRRQSVSMTFAPCLGVPLDGQARPTANPERAEVNAHPARFAATLTPIRWSVIDADAGINGSRARAPVSGGGSSPMPGPEDFNPDDTATETHKE